MPEKPAIPELKRRWWQFSPEGLIVILVVLAACVGMFYWVSRSTRDDEARAKVGEQLKAIRNALEKFEASLKK